MGAIVGFLPPQNTYVLEFAENTTIDGLAERARSLRALPSVVFVSMSVQNELDTIDLRDSGRGLPGTRTPISAPWDQIGLFQAVDAIRSTPPFHERSALKPVKVAVVDTGFKPLFMSDFTGLDGRPFVTLLKRNRDAVWEPLATLEENKDTAHQ